MSLDDGGFGGIVHLQFGCDLVTDANSHLGFNRHGFSHVFMVSHCLWPLASVFPLGNGRDR